MSVRSRYLPVLIAILLASIAGNTLAQQPTPPTSNCTFSTNLDNAGLYGAPVVSELQRIGTLEAGRAYAVLARRDALFYVALDHAYGGWVDRRAGTLSGAGCETLPEDTTPLEDYGTICFFRSAYQQQAYAESSLINPQGTLSANVNYIVLQRSGDAYYVQLDSAFGVWVAASGGQLSGSCANIPYEYDYPTTSVTALENARLWDAPGVRDGGLLVALPEGAVLTILSGPVSGPIRFDSAEQGEWYQVRQDSTGFVGWVWAGRLDFGGLAPGPITNTAVALDNARVWTQPDVITGSFFTTLQPGEPVTILSGPVVGRIRQDTGQTGDWYQIRQTSSGITGWVWAGRLDFSG